MKILNRWDNSVIYEDNCKSLKETVEASGKGWGQFVWGQFTQGIHFFMTLKEAKGY